MLWTGIATGALLLGAPDGEFWVYLDHAMRSLREEAAVRGGGAVDETLRARIVLANTFAMLEDYARFAEHLAAAQSLAWGMCSARAQLERQGAAAAALSTAALDTGPAAAMNVPVVDEDLWYLMEGLQQFKVLLSFNKDALITSGRGPDDNGDLSGPEPHPVSSPPATKDAKPYSPIVGYMPGIQGLPAYSTEQVRALALQGGFLSEDQARTVAQNNIVAAALTQLARPDVAGVEGLVSAATWGLTRLLPMTMSCEHRCVQVMQKVLEHGAAAAQTPGTALLAIVDRIMAALGAGFFRRTGFAQLQLMANASFLRLLAGDEEGCLNLVLAAVPLLQSAPGLIRFPGWQHLAHWHALLLWSAERHRECAIMVAIYQSLNLGGRCQCAPLQEFDFGGSHQCRQLRCAAVHAVLQAAAAAGRARVFRSSCAAAPPPPAAAAAAVLPPANMHQLPVPAAHKPSPLPGDSVCHRCFAMIMDPRPSLPPRLQHPSQPAAAAAAAAQLRYCARCAAAMASAVSPRAMASKPSPIFGAPRSVYLSHPQRSTVQGALPMPPSLAAATVMSPSYASMSAALAPEARGIEAFAQSSGRSDVAHSGVWRNDPGAEPAAWLPIAPAPLASAAVWQAAVMSQGRAFGAADTDAHDSLSESALL
eukprot:TRINITY_DN206_c2_g1_i1.p1 TRINITY_DN206_c2_g1~~TRINITY_DN206_c2_g1_i1.p1  ORF type:complete len:649 (-),score=186.20 TRINITY_DN206_c2_g1_i1:338-2284(-)